MFDSGKLFNLFHRLRAPSAWASDTRDVVRHYLSQGKLVNRLTLYSSTNGLDDDQIQAHYSDLESVITGLKGVPIYLGSEYNTDTGHVHSTKRVFQVGQNYLETELYDRPHPPNFIQVDISGPIDGEVEALLGALKPWVREPPVMETKSRVYTLMQDQNGVSVRPLGKTEVAMEPNNYDPETVERYQHIVDCMVSAEPCGRFCLFDGPPGTGKSYLIRSLISTLDAVFILIPSAMIGSLSGPALLPTFLNMKNNKRPLVLVLEDADMALVSRQANRGNPAALAEVLNLGDGLIGEMLDLRIIATTNAERIELDPAITRPGRMCTHLTLGTLPAPQLAGIYNRLTESEAGPELVKKSQATTLAEVYRLARDAAWAAKDTDDKDHGTYL